MGLSIADNTNTVAIRKISRMGVVNNKKGVEIAQAYCDKLRTKTPSVFQLVKNLSGGNQQKVVISKWLAEGSELFIFDEPTVGVDVGAKLEIYKVFETLIKEGKTIIIVSSYLPEVMGLSDRMLVMYEGKQMGILNKDEYQDERILRLTVYGVYVFCAVVCGIAGILLTSRLGNGVPTSGDGYELDAIAAAVVGGASLDGGEGSVIGTVLGAMIMAMLRQGGTLLGINSFIMEIIIGSLIALAVVIDKIRRC